MLEHLYFPHDISTFGPQNDSMFSLGNAMSRAPIINGMRKLPKHPTKIGITTKKIMMVACIVNIAL